MRLFDPNLWRDGYKRLREIVNKFRTAKGRLYYFIKPFIRQVPTTKINYHQIKRHHLNQRINFLTKIFIIANINCENPINVTFYLFNSEQVTIVDKTKS